MRSHRPADATRKRKQPFVSLSHHKQELEPLPYSAIGALLMRQGRDKEAEEFFRRYALTADTKEGVALRILSEIRLRAGDAMVGARVCKASNCQP